MSKKNESYPFVSIVIVNFNGKELLKQCLHTLLNTNYPEYETIIVDNASTDGSLEDILANFGENPRIKIVKNSKNLGHAEGCNIGARITNSQYIVFLDSDIEFATSNWLLELIKVMENDSKIGLAQAKILLEEDNNCLDYVCVAVDVLGTWAATYGLKEEKFKKNFEIFAASSGCCIIRRDVFDQVGGFDAEYFIYDDDTDLSLRARLLGYRIMFVSSAVVLHRGGILRGVSGMMLYHSSKNRLSTVIKNFQLKNVWWRFLLLTFFTLVVSASFFTLRKHDEGRATLKGALYSVRTFSNIWRKRLIFQHKRRIEDSELIRNGFIRHDLKSTLEDLRLKLKYMV